METGRLSEGSVWSVYRNFKANFVREIVLFSRVLGRGLGPVADEFIATGPVEEE